MNFFDIILVALIGVSAAAALIFAVKRKGSCGCNDCRSCRKNKKP